GIRPKIDRINPFDGLDRLRALTLEDDLREGKTGPVTACFRACYQGMSRIMRNNLLDGAVLAHEIAWHFVRGGKFSPYVKPNAHVYCNCKRELTVNDGLLFHRHLADSYRKLPGGGRLYSIVHLEELTSAKQARAWHHYNFKPHKFIKPYMRAVAAGVDLE